MARKYTRRPVLTRLLWKARVDEPSGCWIWTSSKIWNGYGTMLVDYKHKLAHRLSYELFVGPIPAGLTLDHLCRTRACIHPRHLEPVTLAENKRRGLGPSAINARKKTCNRGHPFDRVYDGHRHCGRCDRRRALEQTARRQEGR